MLQDKFILLFYQFITLNSRSTFMKYDVIVVGAGASGLIAAGRAAELGANVLLVEKMPRIGLKLRITGKGRCNITNTAEIPDFINQVFPNGRFLRSCFSKFYSDDIIELLNRIGVNTKIERGGRVFPESDKAVEVVEALEKWLSRVNVTTVCDTRVKKLLLEDDKVVGVLCSDKNSEINSYLATSVILTTGGASYPLTGSAGDGYYIARKSGHNIVDPRPALVPLETEEKISSDLVDQTLKNINAVLWVNNKKQAEEFGEMVFAKFGLTGPVILTLSRRVVDELINESKVEITIDLKPALDDKKLENRLLRDIQEFGKLNVVDLFKKWIPSSLVPYFMDIVNVDPQILGNQISSIERKSIRVNLKNLRFNISGYRPMKEAIVTAGGISTKDIVSKTMASKKVGNLFFAGEVIDVDANTGGYNLQIAFSTGWVAAENAVEIVKNV